jgi:hypothetical protein
MSIIQFAMKTHSVENVTAEFAGLNNCIVHNVQPIVEKVVYGRRKYTSYRMLCKSDSCRRCTDEKKDVVNIWNKWNPKQTSPCE